MRPLKILKDFYCWAIAILYMVLVWLGWYMVGLTFFERWYHDSLTAHKSLGMIMLLLVLVRVVWIISAGTFRKFLVPISIATRYKRINFYLLMAGINITGFLISTSAGGSIKIFGFVSFPAIVSLKRQALEAAIFLHYYLAYGSVVFILVHAFIKHRPRIFSRFKTN